MPASLFDYLTLRRPPAGRIVFALGRVKLIATEAREPGLQARLDATIAQGRATMNLEREWDVVRATRTTKRGDAALIDVEFDQAWSAFESALKGQLFGPPDDPVRQAAEEVLGKALPQGVGALTQQSFEVQLGDSESILDALEGELAPQTTALGLTRHVGALRELGRRFRAELERDEKPLTHDVVVAAQVRTQELYAGIVFDVLGRYAGTDVAAVARREELLAEVNRQDQALRDLYRRHRPELDIDPDSGEVTPAPVPVPLAPVA